MKYTYSNVEIDRALVLKTMNCQPDSPVYNEVMKAYEELLPQVNRRVEAVCLLGLGMIEEADQTEEYPAGTRVIYVIVTVGAALSRFSSELFDQGEYLKGAMADAMADACLFGLEKRWMVSLREYCRELGVGVSKRLEPPAGLPMTVQKTAWEQLNARKEAGIEITSGYMYQPLKSACQVLVVSEDACQFRAAHDCRQCPRLDCWNRQVKPVTVTICTQGDVTAGETGIACAREDVTAGDAVITCREGESILEAYQRQLGYASAVCGGHGTCGKCRIQLLEGELEVTAADKETLSKEELSQGYRLSCRAYPQVDCRIRLCFQGEEELEVLSQFWGKRYITKMSEGEAAMAEIPFKYAGIAIDIGTTTLAAQLVDLTTGRILASASAINHQRAYGADVISRLEASNSGKDRELQLVLRRDLDVLVSRLLQQAKMEAAQVTKVILAGNTVMCHLLMGYPCQTLGVYPFTPVNLGIIHGTYEEILGEKRLQADTWIFPGFSTYVGGDITAGLYACGMEQSRDVRLLVDLGTNGEMALGSREKLIIASVAAGPAFEGGNISCGAGSIPGAVSHVRMDPAGKPVVETIQGKAPVGICGTGVIELAAELLRTKLVDETGRMNEDYEEWGYPFAQTEDGKVLHLTQKDVRELQLAKAAVRAGVETLIKRYGIGYEEVSQVLLAGGMGFGLDKDAAVAIGLLPEAWKDKITAVGNSSLAGCVRALLDEAWQETAVRLTAGTRELELAADDCFGAGYIEHMMFPMGRFKDS